MKYKPQIVIAYFKSCGLPVPEMEYQFHDTRKWRFDFCWVVEKVALEVEGAIWTGGRHSRGSGVVKDIEKYNAAALAGYMVLRCTPQELCMLETVKMVERGLILNRLRRM